MYVSPPRITLPATSDFAFWASLMVSWVAQDCEGLLAIDQWALWLIALAAIALTIAAFVTSVRKPWPAGFMKLPPSFAQLIFVTMIVLTATWIIIGIAFTRTPTAQALYALCALLSGWSAWAIFITLRDLEAPKP